MMYTIVHGVNTFRIRNEGPGAEAPGRCAPPRDAREEARRRAAPAEDEDAVHLGRGFSLESTRGDDGGGVAVIESTTDRYRSSPARWSRWRRRARVGRRGDDARADEAVVASEKFMRAVFADAAAAAYARRARTWALWRRDARRSSKPPLPGACTVDCVRRVVRLGPSRCRPRARRAASAEKRIAPGSRTVGGPLLRGGRRGGDGRS